MINIELSFDTYRYQQLQEMEPVQSALKDVLSNGHN